MDTVALSRALRGIALVFPLLSAIGWTFRIPLLTQGGPDLPPMQPLTVVALAMGTAAILATPRVPARGARSWIAVLLATSLVLLGVIVLSEYAFGWNVGIDRLLLSDMPSSAHPYPGRPSPQTALTFALLGVAVISLTLGLGSRRVGQMCALLAAANAIIAATGYVFGSDALYGFPAYAPAIGMAIHTAAAFVLLAIALLCRQPTVGVMTLVTSDTHTGAMLRPFLASAIVAPAFVGGITRLGVIGGWYGLSTQISMFVLVIGGLILLITWRAARSSEQEERRAVAALDALQQTNQQLHRAIAERQIFAALVENSSDFIGIADANGAPTYLNPGGRRMVGLAGDFAVERTAIRDYYAPEQREFAANVIVKSMLERGHWEGETAFRHWQTGAAIPVSDTHFLIRHPATNEVLGMGTITRDISDARRAREEIEASNRRLQEANEQIRRLYDRTKELDALKTDFFANVSHEFRTPLTLILGSLDKYARPSSDISDELRRVLNVVLRNARTLLRYVDDLLDVARLDAGGLKAEYVEADVADVVRLLSDQFSVVAGERTIAFHVDTPPQLRVQIDPGKFQRIVLNLLANAFKYTPDGGRIRVALTALEERFRLEIADSGPGIPVNRREEVFERFRRLEHGSTSARGAGLGLSIVKEFAGLLGGSITIGDAPEGGALCVLELPCSAPCGTSVAAQASGLSDTRTVASVVEDLRQPRTGREPDHIDEHTDIGLVLVVEDHPDMNRFIADIVKSEGFDVASAFDGRDAYAKAVALKPALMVTDVMMPEMDGRDLIKAVRQHPDLRTLPIVVLTARADEETRVQLLRGGADDYLDKPFSSAELLVRVRNLIARKHSQDDATRLRHQLEEVADASRRVTEAVAGVPESSVLAVFQTIALKAASLTRAEYAAAGIGTDENRPFETWAFTGLSQEQARLIGSYPRPVGLLGLVSRENRTIRLRDLHEHPHHRGFPPNHPVMTSFMGTPIRFNSHAVGNLYAANKIGAPEFTDEDQRVFEMLAESVGAAIEAARLYSSEGLQRAWLEAVVDQMPEGVVLMDADGHVTMMNQVARSLAAAKPPADHIGHHPAFDLRRPSGEAVPADELPIVTALSDRATTQRQELVAHRADGGTVPVLVSAAPIQTPGGTVVGATMILQDVSTLKELERLREEWASIVAHDLQQPVHTVLLRTDLLLRTTLTDDQAESIRQIRIAITNLGRMVRDLMDASLLEADRLRIGLASVNVRDLLDDIVRRAPDVASRVALRTPPQPLVVRGDAQRLEQVVVNLLSNAVKYGASGAPIVVDVNEVAEHAIVSVTNRGAGIPAERLPYVFDRYVRSGASGDQLGDGLGLGLYIARGLVEAHGGRIWAESTPGETTTLRFSIPLARASGASPESEPEIHQVSS